jgi:hypothetical protein
MKIEKSKHYKTRDGLKVWIADVNPFDRAPRAVKGVFCTENDSPYLPEWYLGWSDSMSMTGTQWTSSPPGPPKTKRNGGCTRVSRRLRVGDLVRHKAVDTHHQFIVERIAGGHAFYHRPEGWGDMECNDQFSLLTLIAEAPARSRSCPEAGRAEGV